MGNEEVFTCLKALLVHVQHRADEVDEGKHYWHFYPASQRENSKSYIIIDMDKDGYPVSSYLPSEFPHELYHMKAEGEEKRIANYEQLVKDRLLPNIRSFTDHFYPWCAEP
ncbi:hypothetical protein N7528_009219 [Penicillium herquei]|nr:hypothetical protein N7528_009219 [Penicillium herquei]